MGGALRGENRGTVAGLFLRKMCVSFFAKCIFLAIFNILFAKEKNAMYVQHVTNSKKVPFLAKKKLGKKVL